ncbi:MAG: carboxypeptidase regulatory-like domain-containing protein [Candidatus Thermoplasmatota archaeon]|nr:carboxypeptidase regulatory-like domain-containing protein [Candidatus Thermoplasmatota archaeon]
MKSNCLKKIKIFIMFALIICTSLIPSTAMESTSKNNLNIFDQKNNNLSTQETEYWALLIAVGVYADYPEQNRPLMLNEVDDFYNVLIQSDVWDEHHIKVIKAEDATVSNIISGFRWLDKMEDENDISLVYITTHGSPIGFDIPPFDEKDKTDEMLSTYWSFAYHTQIIWDDEINFFLNRLESKGVCLIVDSCYAGGFNDPPDWNHSSRNIFSYIKKFNNYSSKEWIDGFIEDVGKQNRVVLMASREDELSYSGGFAPYLIDGLRGYADSNSDGIVTAEEAFFYTQPRTYRQHPTIYDGYPGELPLIFLNKTLKNFENEQKFLKNTNTKSSTCFDIISENSVIKGFVKEADTNNFIKDAVVYVSGRNNQWEFFENQTTTDYNGFYSVNVPAGRCRVTVSSDGYCSAQSGFLLIEENETLWVNFSLLPRPFENSIICGYIKDRETGDPINGANINLLWQDNLNHFYLNDTFSDYLGFYQMNVAAGTITLEVEADGYFQKSLKEMNISDYETLWVNFSLDPKPLENSVLCGYITDKETGVPLNNVRVTTQWVDITLGNRYNNQTYTDSTGFYKINVASGELYLDIRKMGYDYYDPYRHDVGENKTLWLNITLEKQTIDVDIAKPLKALYINNKRIIPCNKARIIGSIDIEAYIFEDWYGHSSVDKIEFYIDGVLKETVTSEPYVFKWDEKKFGKHTIKVIAYDLQGKTDSKEIVVYKFL